MKINQIQNFFFGSLRGRLILSVALLHAVMMSLFIADSMRRQQIMLLDRQVEEATALSQALSITAAEWLAANDIAGLQELVDAQNRYPEIIFAMLTDHNGRILAHSDQSRTGQFLLDLPNDENLTMVNKSPDLVDVLVPVVLARKHVGWARIGIGQKNSEIILNTITRDGVFYALLAVLIGSFIAWFMGRRITRRLYAVQNTILEVKSGNLTARSGISGADEAASIASEFNTLLDTLDQQNRKLQAISNCNQVLMRAEDEQNLLNDVCRIISDEAGYRLVWVGYAENDDAKNVRPVAWAGFDSGYIADAKLSWSANTERGRGPGGESIRTGKIVYIQDFATDPRMAPWRENALHRGYHSAIALPLKDENANSFGVLLIYSTEIKAFSPDEIRLLEELAGDLAFGIMVLRTRSERNLVEEALKESAARLNESQYIAHLGSWDLDIVNNVLKWSDEIYRIFEIDPDKFDASYEAFLDAIHPDDREEVNFAYTNSLKTRMPYAIDHRLLLADGRIKYVHEQCESFYDADGKPLRSIGIVQDITEQKKSEEAVKESGIHYHQIVDLSQDMIIIHQQGKVVFINEAGIKLVGASRPDQIIGRSVLEFVPPAYREIAMERMQLSVSEDDQKSPLYEQKLLRLDGTEIDIELRGMPIHYQGGKAIQFIARDITERKRAEESQEKERKRMEVLLSALNTGLSLINPDMTIAWVNEKIREMFPDREPVGQVCHVFYESRATLCEGCGTMKAFETGKVIESEQLVPSVGKWYYIISQPIMDTAGRVVNVLEGITDITERKQADQKLKLLNFALNNVYDEAYLINEQARFDYVNDESCKALNYSHEELLGMTVAEIDPDFPLELWPQHWADLKKQNSIVFESHHKTREGRIYPVEISANYFKYNGQGYNLALVRDITERKKAGEEIIKLNQELEQRVILRTAQLEVANKELETFAYSVSHDLRAPLRGIDGFSQVLLEEYQDKIDEQGKDYLRRVRSASQRMGQLIDDILNLSRVNRSEINIQQVNLSEMFQEIADGFLRMEPERQVQFVVQKGIKARGDSHLLRIVLENLIGNAWKFTSNHPTALIEFGVQNNNETPVYFVRDDGAGFNMKYAQKLFGAFQRLHKVTEFPGTGIGLATVQRVIHRHGGEVWAEAEIEKGATIYFTIP